MERDRSELLRAAIALNDCASALLNGCHATAGAAFTRASNLMPAALAESRRMADDDAAAAARRTLARLTEAA